MVTEKKFREATPETEETPDQFVIRLKNYLAKWLELSEDLAMYLLERGPKDLVELTTWAQKYLIAHKEQLGKSKATVQPRRADQKKTTQSKPDSSQGRQRSLHCYRCRGFGHRQSVLYKDLSRQGSEGFVDISESPEEDSCHGGSVRRGRRKGIHMCGGRGNQIQEKFEEEWYRRIDLQ